MSELPRTSPIHGWRLNPATGEYVSPTYETLRLRLADGTPPELLVGLLTFRNPERIEQLAAALVEGAQIIRLTRNPADELTQTRRRVAELEAQLGGA